MRILLATDSDGAAAAIAELLVDTQRGSAQTHRCTLPQAIDRAIQVRPAMVILVLGEPPERALELVSEIKEVLPTRVVIVGPANDPRLILRAQGEGINSYVDQDQLETELPAALRRLSLEPMSEVPRGRVISVLGASGGSGASTLAVNIASCLSQKHGKCALLDLKLEAGDLATLLNLKPQHSLADFCQNVNRMDQSMFERCFARYEGIHLLGPPEDFSALGQITVRGVRKALAMCRNSFPYVVIDMDRSFRREHSQALCQSDTILLMLRLDFPSLRQASRTLNYLESLGIERERVRLAISRYGESRQLKVRDVEETLGAKVSYYVPDAPRYVSRAVTRGVPVVVDNPRAKVSASLFQIAHSVNGAVPRNAEQDISVQTK